MKKDKDDMVGPKVLPEVTPGYAAAQKPENEEAYHGRPAPHVFPTASAGASTYGHDVTRRVGAMRVSGHPGAHRIGGRKK